MTRPEFVYDALHLQEDGSTVGHYNDLLLRPAYQPIYEPSGENTFSLHGFEGLIRVYRGDEPLDPDSFFPHVEKEDQLFVECMCMALHIRNYKLLDLADKTLFINVDVSCYPSIDILERELYFTFSQLVQHGLDRHRLVFEILETEVLELKILKRVCELFRSNNFRFALDDFGTQYSNLERFLQTEPDIVKFDRKIFGGFTVDVKTRKLLHTLIQAFHSHGAHVLIEGLETGEESLLVNSMDVGLLQGYGLARPQLLPYDFIEDIMVNPEPNSPGLSAVNS